MSLILDALRRADSERERGTVPGLNAQPEPVATSEPERRAAPRTEPWVWMGAGVGIGLAVVLGAYVFGRDAALKEGGARPSAAAVAEAPVPAGVPPTAVASTAPSASSPSSPSSPSPAASAGAPVAATAVQPVAEPAPWPSADARSETRNETRKPAAKAGTPARAADDGARTQLAAGPPVLPLDQLPANLRAQLPALAFGGSMYSSNPANRSLIINGQIHRENDRIAGDLTLLEIRPRGAVFGFKGQRFEVPY